MSLVGRLHPDANLHDKPPPPPTGKKSRQGRPRVEGGKRPAPSDVVESTPAGERKRAVVGWYGGGKREVELLSGTGHRYEAGRGLAQPRRVFVHDPGGTHRDEYFFSTDPSLTARQVVTLYAGRWCIEVTFEEVRAWLGLQTPRQWARNSVLRRGPRLLGLFSVVGLIYAEAVRLRGGKAQARCTGWYDKPEPTLSDAMRGVRRLFRAETVLKHPRHGRGFQKLPRTLKNVLLDYLSDAA